VTTILLATLVMAALILGWLQNRTFTQSLTRIQEQTSQETRDWGTKALARAEASATKALTAMSKTNDSLCLIFQNQMAPQARQTVTQPELGLEWAESVPPHPREIQEAVEDQLERRRQWSSVNVWSDPTQVKEALKENQNGVEPPPDPSLVALDYDPSP
jgi:hypothetical protein